MTYYKAFNDDLTCLGYQFEVGKTYTIEGELKLCRNGFHCCSDPLDCFVYYDFPFRLCEVRIGDNFITKRNQTAAEEITIIREIVGDELKNTHTKVVEKNGNVYWYVEGKLHSVDDKPAVITHHGNNYWYSKGAIHRDGDLPAVVTGHGNLRWFKNGICHRDGNLPAVIRRNGQKYWSVNGRFSSHPITPLTTIDVGSSN